jgi:hypothetical protein
MAAWDSFDGVVTGRIAAVNAKGLKLEGHTEWLNVSRFAVGVLLPERGAAVACTLDKAGYIRSIEVVGALPAPVAGASDAPAASDAKLAAAPSSTKDRTITRLAVLKAAAEFAAARQNLKSGDVLKVAASWERWVLRDDASAVDDLEEAF